MTRTRIIWLSITALVVVGLVITAVLVFIQPFASLNGTSLSVLRPMIPASAKQLYCAALLNYREYRINSSRWSFLYFGCTFGAAMLSAFASVILKLDSLASRDVLRKDLAAGSAALAALLITLATMGRFEEKWRANRLAASAMENTAYDLANPSADAKTITAIIIQMEEINRVRDEAVVAKLTSTAAPPGDRKPDTQAPTTTTGDQRQPPEQRQKPQIPGAKP